MITLSHKHLLALALNDAAASETTNTYNDVESRAYGRGVVGGVLITLMAQGLSYPEACDLIRPLLPVDFNPDCSPGEWTPLGFTQHGATAILGMKEPQPEEKSSESEPKEAQPMIATEQPAAEPKLA